VSFFLSQCARPGSLRLNQLPRPVFSICGAALLSGVLANHANAAVSLVGFASSVRTSGSNKIIDVFAVMSGGSKFTNLSNVTLTTNDSNGFYQAPGLAFKSWKPDSSSFNSTRNSIDSFVTAGTYSGGAYGGEYYASTNTTGGPGFTGTSYNSTPASPVANMMPVGADWSTGDPTSIDNISELLSSGYIWSSADAQSIGKGTWIAHLVIQNPASDLTAQLTGSVGSTTVTNFDLLNGGTAVPEASSSLLLLTLGAGGLLTRRRTSRKA